MDPVASPLYLDDLAVGQIFEPRARRTLDAESIKAFAREFDPQPFHTDESAAQSSVFAGLAASGWQVAGTTMRLLVDGGMPIAGGLVGAAATKS